MLSFHSPYCITPKCKLHSSTQAATPKPNANAGATTTIPEITCQELNDFRETAENSRSFRPCQKLHASAKRLEQERTNLSSYLTPC
ncbi:hypothetical protein AVEN_200408-1 [Araneus ventricosus]|uniref:Uncharacterized protein n=1 Tax=Araneus ventricosus TaxID=182803 RepID=A0A4Y2LL77_ARAVE|nr:hypothetical protein AVEN_5238-1 [Araneus ventricosus]GBN15544.1 hypothetical protein AVEN_7118-1 [Araneus ventricosus]GBN15683.1 hypothetical protein AVEN_200408-1 [Araneus ventricosus]